VSIACLVVKAADSTDELEEHRSQQLEVVNEQSFNVVALSGLEVRVFAHKIKQVPIFAELQAHEVPGNHLVVYNNWLILVVGVDLDDVGMAQQSL